MDVANLVTVTRGYCADDFKHYSLEVHLGPRGLQWISEYKILPQRVNQYQILPQRVVVAGDDVSQLCCLLPRICYSHYTLPIYLDGTPGTVDLELNVRSNAIAKDEKDDDDNDPPSVKRLLEPFRQLYGYNVTVEGHVTTSYKKSIEASAAVPPPTASDVVSMVSKGRDEGNEAMQIGSLDIALLRYQSALNFLMSAYRRFTSRYSVLAELKVSDASNMKAMDLLQLSLRSLLADTYLKVGEYAKSYACAQDLDCWTNLFPHQNASIQPDLVRMTFCKALAGKALGEPVQALRDIDEALEFFPNDEAMKEERIIICGLVRKKLQSDVRETWARSLNSRTRKLKEPKRWRNRKRSMKYRITAEDYSLGGRKDLEKLIDQKEII